MTIAAEQCREYILAKHPGVRIGRRACRDTAKGDISQHSAYKSGDYDSNALDIMGGPVGWTWDQNVELIQTIVDDLNRNLSEWSIRKILWRGVNHRGHAHIDFYPMITLHKWCSKPTVKFPVWRYSDGTTIASSNPDPENGLYRGEELMPTEQWHQMIDALFEGRPDMFRGDPDYWKNLDPNDPQWKTHFFPAFVRAISLD